MTNFDYEEMIRKIIELEAEGKSPQPLIEPLLAENARTSDPAAASDAHLWYARFEACSAGDPTAFYRHIAIAIALKHDDYAVHRLLAGHLATDGEALAAQLVLDAGWSTKKRGIPRRDRASRYAQELQWLAAWAPHTDVVPSEGEDEAETP